MATGLLPLPSLLRASAHDAGCARMRRAGRTKWSREDADTAAAELYRLVEGAYGAGAEGWIRFQAAAELERAGRLSLRMTPKELGAAVDRALEPPQDLSDRLHPTSSTRGNA